MRSLLRHTRRTLFLGGALALVTALYVLLVGLAAGMQETMLAAATTLQTGHLNVGGFFKYTAGQGAPILADYRPIEAITRKTVPNLDYLVQRGRGWAKLVSDTGSMQAAIFSLDIAKEPRFLQAVRAAQGRVEDLAGPGSLLLFEDQARRLGVKPGDRVTMSAPTERGVDNVLDVRVVAVAKNLGLLSLFGVFVSDATLRSLYQLNNRSAGVLQLYLTSLDHLSADAERLRAALKAAGYRMMDPDPQPFFMKFERVNREDWTGQKLDVTTWEDELSFLRWILTTLDALTVMLIAILLVIVSVGIMNTMWIAIRERTREIGTLRAIGMRRRRVLWMFLLEALLLGAAGGAAGALLGALAAGTLNLLHLTVPVSMQFFLMSDRLFLAVHFPALVRAIVGIVAVTGLAALYPAWKASGLQPVKAMSHAG